MLSLFQKSPKRDHRVWSPGLDDEPVKLDEGYALAQGTLVMYALLLNMQTYLLRDGLVT